MKKKVLNVLMKLPNYQKFDANQLTKLINSSKIIEIPKGTEIIREGDISDKLYILVSGLLTAIINYKMNSEIVLGNIYEGEILGEMGFIQKIRRSCSVVSKCDSILLEFNERSFEEHINSNIVFSSLLNQSLIHRLRLTIDQISSYKNRNTAYLTHLTTEDSYSEFVAQLEELFQQQGIRYLMISESYMLENFGREIDERRFHTWMREMDESHDCLLFLHCENHSLRSFYQENINRALILIGLSDSTNLNTINENNYWVDYYAHFQRTELLIQRDSGSKIVGTKVLLDTHPADHFYHFEKGSKTDLQRIFRFISGRALGIVMGAGGARGWVHAGVLKAIEELKIPIDYLGGSSVGAIVSTLYALNGSYQIMYEKGADFFEESRIKFSDLTLPKTSISSGKRFTMILKNLYGDSCLEDYATNIFIISYNISQKQQVVMKQGASWLAVRASCSVPGIFPPCTKNGDMLIDGSVWNSLPTDVMRDELNGLGTIVAIDLSGSSKETTKYNFPPALTMTDIFKNQLVSKQYKLPSMSKIILRAMLIGSSDREKRNAKMADIWIKPCLDGTSLMGKNDKDFLIELGYSETMKKVEKWQSEH